MLCEEKMVQNNHEEEHYPGHKKTYRKERKRLSAKDRSKFKKTDREKYEKGLREELQKKLSKKELKRGRVLSITSQGALVDVDGNFFICSLRGLLKREKKGMKNLITVGDFVFIEEGEEGEGTIADIEPRKSRLSRRDSLSRRKEQLIAANIDQVLITMSVVSPPLKASLIERYIIATKKGNMNPVVIINKIDLLTPEHKDEKELLKECKKALKNEGIPVLPISVLTGVGLDALKDAMKGKASVFSGQSGTGKTSLINAVTGDSFAVGATVKKTKKGSHTTTSAHLIPLQFGGWCIDTPGIKSFGVWDLEPDEIRGYFTDIFSLGYHCKFPDCTHIHEKDCAVIQAVQEGKLSLFRYQAYKNLMETIEEEHKRR
jgi:ribosome biogenesis GTPase